jgi:hypothetical protein
MATKKQLAEQVLRKISGGNLKPDRQIDIREIMLDLDQLRDKHVELSYYKNIEAEGAHVIDQQFLSEYTGITVTGGKFTLPASVISLPRNLGIYAVYEDSGEVNDLFNPYIIMDFGANFIYKNKEESYAPSKKYVWFSGKVGNIDVSYAPATINVMLAASSKDIEEDADYPLTPEAETQILDMLFNKYVPMKQVPHDEIEDGQK